MTVERAPDEVGPLDDARQEFLRLACLTYGADDPARPLAAAAMVPTDHDVWTAAACCDAPALARLLDDDPDAAILEGGPFGWPPLLYLAYARHDPDVEASAVTGSVRLLLAHGADPDTRYAWHGLEPPFTALTGAFGEGEGGPGRQPRHPQGEVLARLLLEAGADPHDEQTLYNRMFLPDDSHLVLLFEHGLGDRDGILREQLAWAVLHGYVDRVRLLAAHGLDLGQPLHERGLEGRTAYQLALRAGQAEAARVLVDLGADPAAEPHDRLLAAVLAGDRDTVAVLGPDVLSTARAERPGLVAWAAAHAGADGVRLAVDLGWDPSALARTDVPLEEPWETGLHAAAMHGDLAMARLLLELGADPDVRDCRFDAPPLGWARYGGEAELEALLAPVTKDF